MSEAPILLTEDNFADWRTPCGARVVSYMDHLVQFDKSVTATHGLVYRPGTWMFIVSSGFSATADIQLVYDPVGPKAFWIVCAKNLPHCATEEEALERAEALARGFADAEYWVAKVSHKLKVAPALPPVETTTYT